MSTVADNTELEPLDAFRDRASRWLKENLPPASPGRLGVPDDESWDRARRLQRILSEGGFAGICFPKAYGGQGLTLAHQRAFTEESLGYEMPLELNVPTLAICAATLAELGTEDQKLTHLSAVLRGEEILAQFLSEPKGGSDLAGLTTRADRDGDEWVLNGSKIWSSGAYGADYGLCLARTDWDVPKHNGLTMFLVPVHAPGVTIQRIRQVTGATEFCQEFFDDVRLPADAVVGEVGGGWAAASRLLMHERAAMGGTSPYTSGRRPHLGADTNVLVDLAREVGRLDDPTVREDIGAARMMTVVRNQLIDHVTQQIAGGALPPTAGSIVRLFGAETTWCQSDYAMKVAGSAAVTGELGEPISARIGLDYLFRNAWSLAGGSTEMARNIISERVLGMPREYAADRDVPFNQVKRGR
ncbi:acyl-CoA dehydrogenase family protein [Nocardia macrotermitis]|uniref:Putative acyl-CoA dehydrogenase FadE17 n=1 Tax=Nocardia macrotermitis TaxID=2585198 RepID=A0A7K0CZ53_9NOCA|nr:acyl-CoA dehydrogenase family protein [Nocardia macrotermitis]MQY18765.1 putative acyl-CoA dehydrogenase FadE17 [Nocardia macrotermitis]